MLLRPTLGSRVGCRTTTPEVFAMQFAPLICVYDVEASSRWYQRLLGCRSGHGGTKYERLVSNGRLILQLHDWYESIGTALSAIRNYGLMATEFCCGSNWKTMRRRRSVLRICKSRSSSQVT